MSETTAFIGGGNMASALVAGFLRGSGNAATLLIVEPDAAQRQRLAAELGVTAMAAADPSLTAASLVVWAVKPQSFAAAALACHGQVGQALQLSVMAGVRCTTLRQATGAARIVRAMPNTPALIGAGIAGLYADGASDADRRRCEVLLGPTGDVIWVERETDLDVVTALSGSGPAYVFYLLEAMVAAGERLGLDAAQALRLAKQTVRGSGLLAAASDDAPAALRQRVTSKGGTTQAALDVLEARGVQAAFIAAIEAAARRAAELGLAPVDSSSPGVPSAGATAAVKTGAPPSM
ncbi:MAG: pyrroline-5-carboxylate reductase [Pseudomonadota bacterium]|nr:pyrroline-5-carboxylate reductase [Pseudomonadota bacterium]